VIRSAEHSPLKAPSQAPYPSEHCVSGVTPEAVRGSRRTTLRSLTDPPRLDRPEFRNETAPSTVKRANRS